METNLFELDVFDNFMDILLLEKKIHYFFMQ